MTSVYDSLTLLTPFDIDERKVRVGPAGDGGYIFADVLKPEQSVLSYGISTEYRFDEAMAIAGHKVYMFDHTILGINGSHERMMFAKEGVGGRSDPSKSIYSIEDHLARYGISGSDLILKMDVEGAEYDALRLTDQRVLQRFSQIALEIHGLEHLGDKGFRAVFTETLSKLTKDFVLFHVHANNFDGPSGLHVVEGFPVSSLLELSFVRKGYVPTRKSTTLYPTELDYPNVEQRDKLLWFYPFLPTICSEEQFRACERRISI